MQTKTRPIHQLIDEQVRKWNLTQAAKKEAPPPRPVITLSREPGSGGRLVAQGIAERLGLDLFHQEVLHAMASSAKVGTQVLATLDERGLNMLEDWMAALVNERHLWPDEYARHLIKVVGAISRHGKAVLVGRGANFILPADRRFRIRVVAPLDFRVQSVAHTHDLKIEEARRRVTRTDADRKAFVRKYFNANIADPMNYDMVLNTSVLSIDSAVAAACAAFE
ncbi:MAG: cytidylate kinase-like family protein [Desulfosarcinaceae bacterium]|nr:cytidylate kinase-like family protein [Desulfosarcinaceae bacterium]